MTVFRTPRGNVVDALYRPDTSDWNTLNACITEDEYHLADTDWTGIAVDVGAHIGGVTLHLLADHPGLRVIAVEALPMNVEYLRENVTRNGWADRCTIIAGAADCGTEPVTVAYGASESPFEAEHRYIGGAVWQDGGPKGPKVEAAPVSLSGLVAAHGPIRLVKIDCEGCEWRFLDDPAVASVAEFRGEYHPRDGNGPARLRALLASHDVTCDDAEPFGPFEAVLR